MNSCLRGRNAVLPHQEDPKDVRDLFFDTLCCEPTICHAKHNSRCAEVPSFRSHVWIFSLKIPIQLAFSAFLIPFNALCYLELTLSKKTCFAMTKPSIDYSTALQAYVNECP